MHVAFPFLLPVATGIRIMYCMNDCLRDYRKHSKKCTFYTLRFGCSFAAVNTIKPQLL